MCLFRKHDYVSVFDTILPHWHGTCSWNPPSWKTMTSLSYIVNTMAADALMAQGSWKSAAMVILSSGYVRRLPPDRGIRDRKVSLHSMVLWRFYSETENYIVRPHTTTSQEQVPRSLLNRATSDPRAQTNAFHLRRLLICQNALANTFWPA